MEKTTLGHIKSFAIRTTRMSPAQKRGWDKYGERYIVPFQDEPIDVETLFPARRSTSHGVSSQRVDRKLKIDIGFGMGRELAALAMEETGTDFIGIEVHKPGIGRLLLDLGESGVDNVRVVPHDAVAVCRSMIPVAGVDGIHLFFPDPWPKARHAKRRLVRPGFPELVAPLLKPSGYLYMVTDWEEYAYQMLEILSASPLFRNRYEPGECGSGAVSSGESSEHPGESSAHSGESSAHPGESSAHPDESSAHPDESSAPSGFAPPQIWRPQTAFERKGLAKGHKIFELLFEPVVGNAP